MKCRTPKCNKETVNEYCGYHFRKNERDKERVKGLKSKGICVRCGKNPITFTTVCHSCGSKKNKVDTQRREKSKNKGVCTHCNKMPLIPTRILCEICWYKKVAVRHFGSIKRWEELRELFHRQNICPYSRIHLRVGITATLDHIIPTCRAKDNPNHIGNLQWVYMSEDGRVNLNSIKDTLTHNEFLNLTSLINWKLKDKIRVLEQENAQLRQQIEKVA